MARRVPQRFTRCRFGVAVRDVTPPVGIYHRSWGAATHDVAEGVHRPMTVTAAVMQPMAGDGAGPTLALVGLDHGWFTGPADGAAILQEVGDRTGLSEAEVLLNLSHTHAAGTANSSQTDKPGGHLIMAHLRRLTDGVVEAIEAARADAAPAWITWGAGRCALAANRDFWDEEAGKWACGLNPGAPADDTVVVGRVTRDDGAVITTLVNYACHPTTMAYGARLLSPDFVGATREVLEHAFGAPALFLQGASGELGPVENYANTTETTDRNGRQLGYAAAAALEALGPAGQTFVYQGLVDSGALLGAWAWEPATAEDLAGCEELAAEVRPVDLERKDAETPAEVEARLAVATDGPEIERLTRRLLLVRTLGSSSTYRHQLWFWRLGQARLVSTPSEPYSSFQQAIRAANPDTPTLVLGDTNGWLGYFCPADIYGKGIYQEWQSPFAPGCLEKITAVAVAGVT